MTESATTDVARLGELMVRKINHDIYQADLSGQALLWLMAVTRRGGQDVK
jgi:hypothetical protein